MAIHTEPANDVRQLDLTNFRERRGVSLEQIAEKTKISIRFLRAIEAEEFEHLPGGIFSTSYIRQYAASIGYEESSLLEFYRRKTGHGRESAARIPAASERSGRNGKRDRHPLHSF